MEIRDVLVEYNLAAELMKCMSFLGNKLGPLMLRTMFPLTYLSTISSLNRPKTLIHYHLSLHLLALSLTS